MVTVSVEIGSYLRQARESMGMSLDQLQEKTKIQQSFLVAIEQGEFHKLPSPFYVRTYLRSYANCVKVEPHHILRQYRKEEQAERGLTGVHKVAAERELAQTRRTPIANTSKIPPVTGSHKTFPSPPESRVTLNQSIRSHRITVDTALTIAKSKSGQAREFSGKDDLARREFGYQRSSGMARTTGAHPSQPINHPRQQVAEEVTSPHMAGEVTPFSANNAVPIPERSPVNNTVHRQNSQRFHTVSPPVTKQRQFRSRSDRMKKNVSDPLLPPIAPNERETEEPVSQDTIRTPILSRSAVKNRHRSKSTKISKFSWKKTALIVTIGFVICVLLTWVLTTYADNQLFHQRSQAPKETKQPTKTVPQNTIATNAESNRGTLRWEKSTPYVHHYQMTGIDTLEIKVISPNRSRVQLRTNLGTDIDKNYFIKEVTLSKNIPWSIQYTFTQEQQELYLFFSKPNQTKVQINGQDIKIANYIHIQKID
jgi:transcriptional regulator with XRE-family HTH domain